MGNHREKTFFDYSPNYKSEFKVVTSIIQLFIICLSYCPAFIDR